MAAAGCDSVVRSGAFPWIAGVRVARGWWLESLAEAQAEALEPDAGSAGVVEQPDAVAEQDRGDADQDLVE